MPKKNTTDENIEIESNDDTTIESVSGSTNAQPVNTGVIKSEITTEMQTSYLDYAMSVIVSRALPDVRDGLKPVQRRIIYAMQDQNMSYTAKFHKCAAVIGEVLKKYHPHGDSSVYEALVRMGQDFTLRYPLVTPQGNFGSIDGDPPAAMRYTECKLAPIADELYKDIDKETVRFEMNDLQNYEPIYLPSLLPNLLINGVSGIAVGMATNIPPHNLSEVVDGLGLLIDKADNIGEEPEKGAEQQIAKAGFSSSATVEELTQFIKGPDFPTGGTIYDHKEMVQMYATGKGRVVTQAKMEIEETKTGRVKIIVTEIPYQVNKATLVSKIADLVKIKKIEGIADLRDESNRQGMRIVIELKKEAVPKKIENQLYKYTPLQSTFNTNMVALLDNEPKLMTLKDILEEFVKHRQQIIINRTIYLLKKAKEREHILLGLKIALDNLDEVIALIRRSKDAETAKQGLVATFKLTEIQAQAILDMQLRRLAALERQKIEDELKQIKETIKGFEDLLASPKLIIETVKTELKELKDKYGDQRKTKVVRGKLGEISDEDLVVDETCIITMSQNGYIKRLKEDTYKKQGRGGKGVNGLTLREEDEVKSISICNTHDWSFFFTNTGKVYKMRIWDIPETNRSTKGTALVNFLNMSQNETISAFLPITSDTLENSHGFITFGTKKGIVKKTALKDFENIRSSGIAAIKLDENDDLVWASLSGGDDDIMLVTALGQSIRFNENDIRPMGRQSRGVTGIKIKKDGDSVVGMIIIPKTDTTSNLIVVTERGYGKKTPLAEYKVQNRSGSGIKTYHVSDKTGKIVNAQEQKSNSNSNILIATQSGKIIRLEESQIPQLNRDTVGVRLIRLDESDTVTSVAFLAKEESIEA